MNNKDVHSNSSVHQQLLRHLDALQNAGVEWLPRSKLDPSPLPDPLSLESISRNPKPATLTGLHPLPGVTTALKPPGESTLRLTSDECKNALSILENEVKDCTRCPELCSSRTQTVFGQGRPGVEVCFVGEAPGAEEDAKGLPFVGAAGQLLNRIIAACGLQRENVYLCNVLKCRPPGNRTPLAEEMAHCRGYLTRQLELIQPKYIVMLGSSAAATLLNTTLALRELRGRFHDYRGIPVMVTYHPAYLLPHRNPAKKRDVWEDMKMLLHKMGRPIPQSGSSNT